MLIRSHIQIIKNKISLFFLLLQKETNRERNNQVPLAELWLLSHYYVVVILHTVVAMEILLVSPICSNKTWHTESFKHYTFILPKFGRVGVRHKGVGIVALTL